VIRMERRPGLEPGKTGFAIPRLDHFGIRRKLLAGDQRFELCNTGFGVRCSPNRACPPWCAWLDSNQHCTDFEPAASAVGLQALGTRGGI
jgi:hypothetical protein